MGLKNAKYVFAKKPEKRQIGLKNREPFVFQTLNLPISFGPDFFFVSFLVREATN